MRVAVHATPVIVMVAFVHCTHTWGKRWAKCFRSCSFTLERHARRDILLYREVKEHSCGTEPESGGVPVAVDSNRQSSSGYHISGV